mmetsp:Transcript_208/g.546  ORF Transcript_208/g.546 Transcript_208/m.546 type:complete len:352 (+) Transcript_208:353-1408(+)|eukprot:CAMPEP_0181030998 /NCGR_PEP_ID=MMETSP1070-20121207/6009_1 /TAXON_ID=265543 /ORGANISM="Minutocellus polymorphus, Strain NH13" /LENGTH=351 /DNA_ID=CAMNT_0023108369 /DNA_START=339 /DNA_END=1394 /DNA_ORIENTATION=+
MSDSATIQAGEADASTAASTSASSASADTAGTTAQTPVATALQDLIAGGVAGSASVIVGHPFDTYKVRLQTSKPGCTESTRAFGGFSSLFRGMAAPLSCAAVVNAIVFSSFGESSRLWDERVERRAAVLAAENTEGGDASAAALPHDSFTKSFCCGSFAGFAQSVVICPMEHIKCRLQVQHGMGSADALYRGPFDAVHKIVSSHGFSGLYRGMCVTWWREVPAFGLYFSTYDYIKDMGNQLFADGKGDVKDWHAWGASAFAGGTSGCFTWLIIYPFDIIKTRIQTAPWHTPQADLKIVNITRALIRENGWRFMFRGLGVTLVRAFPVNATVFPVYEFTLDHLVSSGIGGRD